VDALWPLWRPCGLPRITFAPLGCPFRPLAAFGLSLGALRDAWDIFSEISPGPSPDASRCFSQMLLEASQIYFSMLPPRCFRCIYTALQDASRWASLSPCHLFHYPIPLSQLFHGTLCESDSHSPKPNVQIIRNGGKRTGCAGSAHAALTSHDPMRVGTASARSLSGRSTHCCLCCGRADGNGRD